MNYNTIYVGMDIHKESFTLCAYTIDAILTTLVPVNRFKSQGLFLDKCKKRRTAKRACPFLSTHLPCIMQIRFITIRFSQCLPHIQQDFDT